MANKKYALAAWTENGHIRMVPSLVDELSLPYQEKIDHLESLYKEVVDEIGWLLALSRAHEEYARFLLRADYPKGAYTQFDRAAQICACCSDSLWRQGVHGDFPVQPLLGRFLAMHRECQKLAEVNPVLKGRYEGSDLEGLYLWFTLDDREYDKEFEACLESRRAWRFGKTG